MMGKIVALNMSSYSEFINKLLLLHPLGLLYGELTRFYLNIVMFLLSTVSSFLLVINRKPFASEDHFKTMRGI